MSETTSEESLSARLRRHAAAGACRREIAADLVAAADEIELLRAAHVFEYTRAERLRREIQNPFLDREND